MSDSFTTQRKDATAEPIHPEWMRPTSLPDMLVRPGIAMPPLTRLSDWPRLPEVAPSELIVRVTADFVELRVGNVLPVGIWSFLFGICFLPFLVRLCLDSWIPLLDGTQTQEGIGYVFLGLIPALGSLGLIVLIAVLVYRFDIQGGVGDGFTVLKRSSRKVYQRVSKKLSKGEWNWDDLHPYIENRNAISRANQVLTLVELDESMQKIESSVTVEVTGMSAQPLISTYSFLKEFMEHGVTNLPPVKLAGVPEPAWYSSMPPWFFWLPRPLAKSVWAFLLLLFVWPIVVWSRVIRHILPYSRWPADFDQKLKANAQEGTPTEKAWLAANVAPAQRPPLIAYFAFVAAVVVSAPVWWWIVKGYVTGLTKFW
jgi:hypothetical protein